MTPFFRYLTLPGLGWVLAGCTAVQPIPVEELVTQRAEDHAALLMAGDFDEALTYMTPGFQSSGRAAFYRADKAGAPSWHDASVKWVRCEPDPEPTTCQVRLMIKTSRPPQITETLTVPLDDTWILVNGQWYQYADT